VHRQILARHAPPLVVEMSHKENVALSRKPVLKTRLSLNSLGLLLVLALLAFAVPRRSARADGGSPFKATLPVQFIGSQLCAPGDGSCLACTGRGGFFIEAQGLADTSLGPLFAQVLKCFDPNGAPFGTYAGTLTTTAPNGTDSLSWAYAGKNDNGGDFYGFQPFSGTLTITGGTGNFAGAHGSASFTAAGPPTFTAGPSPIQVAGTAFYYVTGQLELTSDN
jgi:hypothetical protein